MKVDGRKFGGLRKFPVIKRLSRKEREDWMIMDDQYFSFEALSRIYSVKDLMKL